jgi:hypothetical protein
MKTEHLIRQSQHEETHTYIAMPSKKTFQYNVRNQPERHHEVLASIIQTCKPIASSTSDVDPLTVSAIEVFSSKR